ncbi:MAG TPA: TatD family hydrolase [Patescibacteria group bacterium]|nr:TatD family hydrolase [Patescibacteria group bacterium]
MIFVDTHAHIQFAGYKTDADEVITRALEAGVMVINVGTQKDTSRYAVEMLNRYPKGLYAAVGLHPEHTWRHLHDEDEGFFTREEGFDYEYYKSLAQNPRVVGIGECGLDYYWFKKSVESGELTEGEVLELKNRQKKVFEQQGMLAQELNKVLCIHCRPSPGTSDAYDDLVSILKTLNFKKFEVHCFTGNLASAKKLVGLGGYLGINGILTFDKTGKCADVVRNIPLEHIILETDAPYLSPAPYRGKRNEPMYMIQTAQKVAELKDVELEAIARQTTENANKLFGLGL